MFRIAAATGLLLAITATAARADDKKEDPAVAALKARLEAQEKELKALRKRVDELENERAKLILDKEAALRAVVGAENGEKLARAIADEYAKKVDTLTAKLRELKLLEDDPERPGQPRAKVALPANLRGTVTKVSGEFVLVNIGIDVGLEPGSILEVVRTDDKNKTLTLGTITITKSVYPKEAVGTFTPARKVPLKELKPEELPRKDDAVRTPPQPWQVSPPASFHGEGTMLRIAAATVLLLAITATAARADDVTPVLKSGVWYADVRQGVMGTRYEYTFRKDGTYKIELLNDVPNPSVTGTWKLAVKNNVSQLTLTPKKDESAILLPEESEVRFDKAKNVLIVRDKDGKETALKFRKR
jgi:hypothetical protein